jgi:hypothetical protein
MSKSLTDSWEVRMGIEDDQENIKRIQQVDNRTRKIIKVGRCNVERTVCDGREEEWKEIRSEMEAGSGGTGVNVSTVFRPEASILQGLRKELKSQSDKIAEFETQDWDDEGEWIAQGWCEALEFAIKLIEGHNK